MDRKGFSHARVPKATCATYDPPLFCCLLNVWTDRWGKSPDLIHWRSSGVHMRKGLVLFRDNSHRHAAGGSVRAASLGAGSGLDSEDHLLCSSFLPRWGPDRAQYEMWPERAGRWWKGQPGCIHPKIQSPERKKKEISLALPTSANVQASSSIFRPSDLFYDITNKKTVCLQEDAS